MGADNSTFAGCAWSEARQHGLWTIQHGKLETGKEVSLFTPAKGDKKSENLLRKLTKVCGLATACFRNVPSLTLCLIWFVLTGCQSKQPQSKTALVKNSPTFRQNGPKPI